MKSQLPGLACLLLMAGLAFANKPEPKPVSNLVVQPGPDTVKFLMRANVGKDGKVKEVVLYPELLKGFSVSLKNGQVELFQFKDGNIYPVPHKSRSVRK